MSEITNKTERTLASSSPRKNSASVLNARGHAESARNEVIGQPDFNQGAHAILQDRAEKNARLLLGLQMEEGLIEKLDFPVSQLPTEQLQNIADIIHKSLANGFKGFVEIMASNPQQEIAAIAQELSEMLAKGDKPNVAILKKDLHAFHIVKTRQELAWKLQTTLNRGEDVSEIVNQLSKIESASKTVSEKIKSLLAERVFNHAEPPEKPIPIFSLSTIPICTAGNISNIQAPPKAGKSAVLESMIATSIKLSWQASDTLSFSAENPENKALIHFDTEQSRYDADSLIRRAMRRADITEPPEWFESYSVGDLDIDERRDCLRYTMQKSAEQHGGIFAVMIDGIGDLCNDPNDSEESFALVGELRTLAIKYDCTILTVLHENPGSEAGKTRGHLGSQLERKAETNLRLAKDKGGITTIWSERARHGHFPKESGTCFAWNQEHKMHRSCGTAVEIKQAATIDKMETESQKAFTGKDALTYTDLVSAIVEHLTLGDRTAKSRIKDWLQAGIIAKDSTGKHSLKDL
jgi:hypothetical protein